MDVAYNRFAPDVIKIILDIAESHFVAFDLEFSGIAPPSQYRAPGKPTLQTLYEESRAAAAKYQILQVGLTIVQEDQDNGQYILKPYNFNINPVPALRERHFTRDFSMGSGAVQFLLKNKFDFGLPFTSGIPYLSRAEEIQARLKLSGEDDRKRPDMILKADDDNLIKHIRQSIARWQEQPEEDREKYLNIPNEDRGKGVPGALNRYQMRLTHQVVQNEFPNFKTSSMQDFVQITNPTQEQRKQWKAYQKMQIDREIGRAVGFRWILEAIAGRDISGMPDECFLAASSHFDSSPKDLPPFQDFVKRLNGRLSRRRRVLVGHNCFTDLMYLHQFFLGELPEQVTDFQESIHELFPAIIDTKYIASFGNRRWGDTSLAAVERELKTETAPTVVIPRDFDRYDFNEKPHEAGYDALLTATIAIKLSAKMEREQSYIDQEDASSASAKPMPPDTAPFGVQEEGYVTASEDVSSEISDSLASRLEISALGQQPPGKDQPDLSRSEPDIRTGKLAVINTPDESDTTPTLLESNSRSEVIVIKDKKPQPITSHLHTATSEITKLNSDFAAANIYDILDTDTENVEVNTDVNSTGDGLVSLSNDGLESPCSGKARRGGVKRAGIDTMVREGRLMPRWDGGNGFWQLFGNKLQVNSSKEGVCDLVR